MNRSHPVPTDAVVKQLYGTASVCAFPKRQEPLYRELADGSRVLNSRVAHIAARSEDGPRCASEPSRPTMGGASSFPIATALRQAFRKGYGAVELRADVLAGIVVGIVALPLSMALAIAVAAPPRHGLYTAIVAGLSVLHASHTDAFHTVKRRCFAPRRPQSTRFSARKYAIASPCCAIQPARILGPYEGAL